jgi:hypothetical protein
VWLATWGLDASRFEGLANRWNKSLERTFAR